jgi:phosphoserine/homoserine phosphotransferase
MHIVCSDLEGVFVPEIWINVAEKTGIEELRLTTRDISDYDVLMKKRLSILDANGLRLKDIQDVIATMEPLEGAGAFLDWLRSVTQLIVVSDTFVEFADPLMAKLNRPTLFCNYLSVDGAGRVTDYHLRQTDGKRHVAEAMKALNFTVIAMGDSYNDLTMIRAADHGILFRPPEAISLDCPDLPVETRYDELKIRIGKLLAEAD